MKQSHATDRMPNKRINALATLAGTLTWRAFGYDARHVSARYAKC